MLIDYVETLEDIGATRLLFDLTYSERPVDEVLRELGTEAIPQFRRLEFHSPQVVRGADELRTRLVQRLASPQITRNADSSERCRA